jgi:hypothetical protein
MHPGCQEQTTSKKISYAALREGAARAATHVGMTEVSSSPTVATTVPLARLPSFRKNDTHGPYCYKLCSMEWTGLSSAPRMSA